MANARYMRNCKFFDRYGHRIPGSISDKIPRVIEEEDPAKIDRENRKQVVEMIEKAIANGTSLEEITTQLANNDEFKQKFKYLSNADLKEVFKSWYKGKVRPKSEFERSIK